MKHLPLFLLWLLVWCSSSLAAQEPVRILAIGNSFSQDAVEQNLHELAAAEGIETIIGNMYIGGCTLERHLENARTNRPAYAYRKIGIDGVKHNHPKTTLLEALADEEWDYVSVQQASGYSGQYATYEASLPELLAFLRAHLPATTEIVLHQTWAYAADSNHKHFPHYHNDQQQMFRSIVDANRRAAKVHRLKRVIPSGVAVQRARGEVGDCLTRDGYHLDLSFGRYVAACTWFEAIFDRSVVGNAFAPRDIDDNRKKVAQKVAHKANRRPHGKRF